MAMGKSHGPDKQEANGRPTDDEEFGLLAALSEEEGDQDDQRGQEDEGEGDDDDDDIVVHSGRDAAGHEPRTPRSATQVRFDLTPLVAAAPSRTSGHDAERESLEMEDPAAARDLQHRL